MGFIDHKSNRIITTRIFWINNKEEMQHDIELNDLVRMIIQAVEFYLYCLFILMWIVTMLPHTCELHQCFSVLVFGTTSAAVSTDSSSVSGPD